MLTVESDGTVSTTLTMPAFRATSARGGQRYTASTAWKMTEMPDGSGVMVLHQPIRQTALVYEPLSLLQKHHEAEPTIGGHNHRSRRHHHRARRRSQGVEVGAMPAALDTAARRPMTSCTGSSARGRSNLLQS